jgi:hypothetical protein
MHQSVVKFDRSAWLAFEAIASLIVVPPAVAIPEAARVVGSHSVIVRRDHRHNCLDLWRKARWRRRRRPCRQQQRPHRPHRLRPRRVGSADGRRPQRSQESMGDRSAPEHSRLTAKRPVAQTIRRRAGQRTRRSKPRLQLSSGCLLHRLSSIYACPIHAKTNVKVNVTMTPPRSRRCHQVP